MTTLFYFSDINELNQFESFTVEPLVNDHANIGLVEGEAKGWSVIGKKRKGSNERQVPSRRLSA